MYDKIESSCFKYIWTSRVHKPSMTAVQPKKYIFASIMFYLEQKDYLSI